MLKKIFLLCFLLSVFLFAQQYTYEKYEKYVGTKLGKYPLTLTGLKRAIASLDSGVVYISYPGLWDTTGLGTLPTKIQLNGWLFGDLINYFDSPSGLNRMVFTRGSDSLDQIYSSSLAENARNNGTYIFYDNKLSWWGNLMAVSFQRENALVVHPSSRTLNADFLTWVINKDNLTYSAMNFQTVLFLKNPNATGYNTAAYMIGTSNLIALRNTAKGTIKDFILSRHTIQMGSGDTLTVSNKIVGVQTDIQETGGSTARLQGTYYAFHSNLSTPYVSRLIGDKYHFYGEGNYPSYFGGDIQADGTSIKFENLPSDSTSLTTGQLYFDSSGFVKRKF